MLQVTCLQIADTDALAVCDDGPGLSSELQPWQVLADMFISPHGWQMGE